MSNWEPTLLTIKDKWPTLLDYENDLRSKVGPLSIMKPLEQRLSDIDSYYDSILLESNPILDDALACVIKEMSKGRGLRLRSQQRTVDTMKKSTNSGSPYFTKRSTVVDKTVPCVVDNTMQYLPHSEWNICAILGWRGQEGGPLPEDVKQRVVWMFPFAVNIEELRVYQPLIEMCQKFNYVPAWVSMESVDERITKLFDTKDPEDLIVCTDFSKFDQHFNKHMQTGASKLLSALFSDVKEFSDWLKYVYPIKYNIPLAYDWNKIRYGAHGMASGSGGTNADETLVHRALQYEAAINSSSTLNPNSQCLGDDGVLSYPGITVEDVVRTYASHGQVMNIDKQYASKQDLTYLRRWHHRDYRYNNVCVGVYSTYRALNRLAEQERYYDPEKWSNKMVALRQLSIIENVKYHPLFEEFVDYCMKGDKFRLGLDIPGFLSDIDKIAKEAIEYMPDFLGYTKSLQTKNQNQLGLSNWRVVKYLQSKA